MTNELQTVGAMHQCRAGEPYSTCVHCGALAEALNKPCPHFMRDAAQKLAAVASPTPQADPLQTIVSLQEQVGMYAEDFAPQADSQPAPMIDAEAVAYNEWFNGEQGTAYDGMWAFARAAWMARAARAPADSVTAPAKTRQIAECYGDCPIDPKTCANPCKFEGRASRTPEKAAPAAGAVAGPTPDVQAKIDSNTWDHFGDILPTLKAISRGDWYWGANSRCKYIEIRLDTRDGGCILYGRDRVRISPEQFAFQAGGGCGKMEPWAASNSLAAAPTPAAQQSAGSIDGQPVLPEASPATKGQCNSERACGACFSGQGSCEVSTTAPPPTVQGLDANDTKRMDWLCDPDSVYWIEINAEPDRREVFSSSQVWRLRAVIDAALAQKEDKE